MQKLRIKAASKTRKMVQEVGKRIRVLRVARGLSQEELGDRSGLHRSHMGQVERGESNVTMETLLKLGFALDVPIVELVKGVE